MAKSFRLNCDTLVSGVALTTALFCFGKLDSNGKVIPCSVSGESSVGIIQENPDAADREVPVAYMGSISKLTVAGALAVGTLISTNTSGKGIAATTGHNVLAKTLEASTADGDVISVLVLSPGIIAP